MRKAEKKTLAINVRLDPTMMEAVESEAEKEERALAAMARILIREALVARGKKTGRQNGPRS